MTTTDKIRSGIIDKLLTITNKEYLSAIYQLVENSKVDTDRIKLSNAQILLLKMSDKDIEDGDLISQENLDNEDMQWLKEQ